MRFFYQRSTDDVGYGNVEGIGIVRRRRYLRDWFIVEGVSRHLSGRMRERLRLVESARIARNEEGCHRNGQGSGRDNDRWIDVIKRKTGSDIRPRRRRIL